MSTIGQMLITPPLLCAYVHKTGQTEVDLTRCITSIGGQSDVIKDVSLTEGWVTGTFPGYV